MRGLLRAIYAAGSIGLITAGTLPAAAQNAYFSGSTTQIASTYLFSHPQGVALDANGDLFVADTGNKAVEEITLVGGVYQTPTVLPAPAGGYNELAAIAADVKGDVFVCDVLNDEVWEIPLSGGNYQTPVQLAAPAGGYNHPEGLAVDANNNVFVADATNNAVEEILSAGGYTSTQLIASGFNSPGAVAVDSNDDVYVGDYGDNHVWYVQFLTGTYQSQVAISVTFNHPEGLAFDLSGNLYVSDTHDSAIKELLASGGKIPTSSPTVLVLGSGFSLPVGVAVDANDNVIVGDYNAFTNGAVFRVAANSVNFGTVNIGTSLPPSFTIPFTFTSGGTIKAPVVLTLGATGLDFTGTGSGPCTTNGTSYAYVSGNTCTVTVQFAPKAPGLRLGAVQIEDSSGNPIATARLYGTGSGPQAVFPSNSTPAVVGSGFSYPNSVAVDGSSDVFVADNGSGDIAVKEIVAVGGKVSSGSTVNTVGSGFSTPFGVAVDGSGDVFVADYGTGAVDEIVAVGGQVSSSSAVVTVGSGFYRPSGVAVDGNGDVFVADYGHNAVKEILATGGQVSSSSTVVVVGNGFSEPWGVSVDGSGDVFVADQGNNAVKEIAAVNGQVSSSSTVNVVGGGFNQPSDVAVDASGDVFVADLDNNAVKEIVASGGQVSSGSTVVTLGSGFSMPLGVAVDANGNVFVADAGNGSVKEIPLATPPTIAFPTVTQEGTTDSVDGPLSATVANNGNTTLTFNLTGGDNPSVPTNFAWDDSSTCDQTNGSSSTAFTLDEGASCTVAVNFAPTTAGSPLTGNVTLTDNSLNAIAVTQQIPLSGTAVNITMTPAANTALPPGSVGTAYSGTTFAASGGSGSYTYSATGLPAGLILDSSSGALSGTPTAVANSASVTVTATDSSSSVQISQNYTITISQGTVTLSWTPPSSITYGTNLSQCSQRRPLWAGLPNRHRSVPPPTPLA